MRTIVILALCLSFSFAHAQELRWDSESESLPNSDVTTDELVAEEQIGIAGFYADYFEGNPTALGEVYHENEFTAAHATLPLGTIVEVTRLDNGLSTTVRINDRGAYCDSCLIDLSKVAAEDLDLIRVGRTRVKIQVMGYSEVNPTAPLAYTDAPFTPKSTDRAPTQTNRQAPQLTARTPLAGSPNSYSTPPATTARGSATSAEVRVLANLPKGYAVQLGSYADFGNAERHVVDLQQKGFNNVYLYQESRTDGTTVNRVVVTPFPSTTDANNYLSELKQYHNMTGLVIRMD